MAWYIVKRVLGIVPIMFIIITLAFLIVRFTPGGPFDAEKPVSDAVRRNLEAKYKMDQPLWKQYFSYIADVARGDLGPSFKHKDYTVNHIIAVSFPISLELGAYAMALALFFGLLLGIWAALFRNRPPDVIATGISIVGLSVPSMVLGPVLVILFCIVFRIFPTSGWGAPATKVLPSITACLPYLAVISRLTRSGMLEVISKDFIRTARAKGLKEHVVIVRHALRAAVLPVISYLGPAVAFILTGNVVVEMIFSIPGMGRYFILSALNRDYTVVLGLTIVLSFLVLMMNLIVDIMYVVLDPRVTLTSQRSKT